MEGVREEEGEPPHPPYKILDMPFFLILFFAHAHAHAQLYACGRLSGVRQTMMATCQVFER